MYNSRVPSFSNEKLLTIFKKYADKKSGISFFNEYSETVKAEKRGQALDSIIKDTKSDLKKLAEDLSSKIKSDTSDLNALKYPHITKNVNMTGEKTFGAVEFGNSLATYKANPSNLFEILNQALEHNRNDFVFLTLDMLNSDTSLSDSEKNRIRNITSKVHEKTGITTAQKKLEQNKQFFNEVTNSLELIETEPQEFDKSVMSTFKVKQIMESNNQLQATND